MKESDANVSGAVNVKQLVSVFDNSLYLDIKELIEETRFNVAQTVNTGITVMYWNIGQKINDDILKNKRAEYGKQIIELLSKQLTEEYSAGWSTKQIRHCLRCAETFPDFNNLVSLIRELSWTRFIEHKNLIECRCVDK